MCQLRSSDSPVRAQGRARKLPDSLCRNGHGREEHRRSQQRLPGGGSAVAGRLEDPNASDTWTPYQCHLLTSTRKGGAEDEARTKKHAMTQKQCFLMRIEKTSVQGVSKGV